MTPERKEEIRSRIEGAKSAHPAGRLPEGDIDITMMAELLTALDEAEASAAWHERQQNRCQDRLALHMKVTEAARWAPAQMVLEPSRSDLQRALNALDGTETIPPYPPAKDAS